MVYSVNGRNQRALAVARRTAQRQGGVITSAQADAAGVSARVRERLIKEGHWRRICRGIYAISPDSWLQRAWAGLLIGGPQAVLGHEAALYMLGLGPAPSRIPVFVGPTAGFPKRTKWWRFIRVAREGRGSPPHTEVHQTIIDVGTGMSADEFVSLVGRALSAGLVTVDRLMAELDGRQRVPQRALMADVLNDVGFGVTSALERRYHNGVEAAHGLPAQKGQGRPGMHKVDKWYEEYGLIVETDGLAFHQGLAASVDMDRDNDHMQMGISTLRFGWGQVVDRPCETARRVADALARGGWKGKMRPCPRCPSVPRQPPVHEAYESTS